MTMHTKGGIARGRGSQQTTANWDRAQLEAVDWSAVPPSVGRMVKQAGTWVVIASRRVQPAAVYVSAAHRALVINPDTYHTLMGSPEAMGTFMRSMTGGASGMKFLAMDAGPYGEAARLEAARAKVAQRDTLDELEQRAQSLIIQASGLAGGATPVQVRIFMERYGEIAADLERIEARLERVRSLVDLAGDAVMASTA